MSSSTNAVAISSSDGRNSDTPFDPQKKPLIAIAGSATPVTISPFAIRRIPLVMRSIPRPNWMPLTMGFEKIVSKYFEKSKKRKSSITADMR